MSFQGDVAGIGLGELLQGLARGGRDGVLNLYGETISGSLGIKSGMLYLLPGPDEDDDMWRERSLAAWSDDPKPLMETRRRAAIARADRLETFYRMLETPNLHFRFEPGSRPKVVAQDEDDPWGQGLPVEYMLLEHARLADEGSESGIIVESFDIPRAIDPGRFPPDVRDFLEQCDGRTSLLEISDRLGWPLRKTRLQVLEHYRSNAVRLAQPRELLAAAQFELEHGRIHRAAARLGGWVRASHPGPPPVGDAELLVGEWDRGRLQVVLAALDPREARALLRKLDRVHADPAAALQRWTRLAEDHKKDALTVLHATVLTLAASDNPTTRAFTDLVRLARSFQDNGNPNRTRTLLRLASYQLPSNPQTRIELGRRMIDTGLAEEGVRWLLDVARELIDANDGERAITPIRLVLKKIPDHTQAHGLLLEARAFITRQRRRRWKSVVIGSVAGVLSLAGVVHLQMRRTVNKHLEEVKQNLAQPTVARELLDEYFDPNDDDDAVQAVRARVFAALKQVDDKKRDVWLERFEEIGQECEYGDPLLGLKKTLVLDAPPELGETQNWPSRMDLLGILTARLQGQQRTLDLSVTATIEDLHAEDRIQDLVGEMIELCDEYTGDPEVTTFHFHLKELSVEIDQRRAERAQQRDEFARLGLEKEQDMMLGTARAHAEAGDLERSVQSYERLMKTEDFEKLRPFLQEEIDAVRKHWKAVTDAERLAEEGEHEQALEILADGCPNDPREHLLPFRVHSNPEEARVVLPGGMVRATPFTMRSGPGDPLVLTLQHEGFEDLVVRLNNPGDIDVDLHQVPERALPPEHRVQALPVPVGDGHVIADRKGRVVRLAADSKQEWTRILETLGGVARTPMFLPRRPGFLLVVSEDGRAWLLDAASGQTEGPLDLASPPSEGPTLTRNGVWLQLEDERIAIWRETLEPTYHAPDDTFVQDPDSTPGDETAPSTFEYLRRSANGPTRLKCTSTGWTVQVREGDYLALGPDGKGFTARRNGDWTFLAWEQPKALLPYGRLWISDEDGLRSYRPDGGQLLRFD